MQLSSQFLALTSGIWTRFGSCFRSCRKRRSDGFPSLWYKKRWELSWLETCDHDLQTTWGPSFWMTVCSQHAEASRGPGLRELEPGREAAVGWKDLLGAGQEESTVRALELIKITLQVNCAANILLDPPTGVTSEPVCFSVQRFYYSIYYRKSILWQYK